MAEILECNLALIAGRCSALVLRTLESGSRLATFAVRAPGGDRATSVPIAWWEPPAWAESLVEGDAVVVAGRVRRRFYRSGAGAASRVELEVERLARAGRAREIQAVIRWVDGVAEGFR